MYTHAHPPRPVLQKFEKILKRDIERDKEVGARNDLPSAGRVRRRWGQILTSQPVDRARERRACVDVHTRGHQLARLQVQSPSGISIVGAARATPSVGVWWSAGNLDARLRGATRCDDTRIGRDTVGVIIIRVQPVDAAAAKLCWLAIADKGWGA